MRCIIASSKTLEQTQMDSSSSQPVILWRRAVPLQCSHFQRSTIADTVGYCCVCLGASWSVYWYRLKPYKNG